jgi:hypothetical protein
MDGSGQLRVRPLTTHNVGVSVLQTLAPGLVVGTTMRVVTGGVEGVDSDTTFDVDAGAMMSAWHIRFGFVGRNLREPEFEGELGTVLMKRHFRIGAALVPRAASSGVHGPFSLDVDADLTTQETPLGDRRGAAVGGEYWLAAGRVGVRAGFRWSTLGDFDRAVSGGLSVKLPKSIYAEGQLTKPRDSDEEQWTVGGRVTF